MADLHVIVKQACQSNDLRELSALKLTKEQFMSVDEQGNTALLLAAATGNISVIRLLDDIGDELLGYDAYKMFSARNKDGYNALSFAAKQGNIRAVTTLYELGAYDIFTANEFDWKIYAAMEINPNDDMQEIAKNLKTDAQKRLRDIYAKNLYTLVTNPHSTIQEIQTGIAQVGNVNAKIYDEHSALFHAILARNVTAVKVLIEQGAKVEPDMLPNALDSKDEEIISHIGRKIPLEATAIEWGTLFDVFFEHAIRHDDATVAKNMLPHLTATKAQEGLLYCAEIDSPDVLKCLLANGVDVNTVENNMRARSAAMLAAKNGHADILRILIAFGANLNQRSERGPIRGLTALDYAKIKRRKECIKVISEALALQKYGDTPLMHTAACGSMTELIAKLTEADVEGEIPDLQMLKNAIRAAKESKQPPAIIKQLQKYMHDHYSTFSLSNFKKLFARK